MMSYALLSTFLYFFNIFYSGQCYNCTFFSNISVIVTPKTRVPYFKKQVIKNFNGCFEQKQFDQIVTDIGVVDQNITELGDHAVHHLPELKTISFTGCGIKNISSRAFEDLPKLRAISINDCDLRSLSGGVFNDLESLEDISLFNNDISDISIRPVFGYMPSLKLIILARNKIPEIDFNWFINSPNIRFLDFSYNKIRYIGKFTFRFMPNLKDLFLDFNEINYIEETAFHNFSSMEILSLRHNKLTRLSPNIIPDKFQVEVLQLNANFLNFLPEKFLKKLSVIQLELEGNPWKCLCLTQIHEWMIKSNVSLKNNGYCRQKSIPHCFYSTKTNYCSETIDSEMTESFLRKLRDINPPIDEECANLS